MSLGIFGDVWEGLEATDHSAQGKFCMFIFLAIAYIMLVNLLIAMMGDTYTKIAEIKNEWMRQVINEFSPLWCHRLFNLLIFNSGQGLCSLSKDV